MINTHHITSYHFFLQRGAVSESAPEVAPETAPEVAPESAPEGDGDLSSQMFHLDVTDSVGKSTQLYSTGFWGSIL